MEQAGRLKSLGAFRGFAIATMVLVSNPGLAHAKWHGAMPPRAPTSRGCWPSWPRKKWFVKV